MIVENTHDEYSGISSPLVSVIVELLLTHRSSLVIVVDVIETWMCFHDCSSVFVRKDV
jgi:hypothetical protein